MLREPPPRTSAAIRSTAALALIVLCVIGVLILASQTTCGRPQPEWLYSGLLFLSSVGVIWSFSESLERLLPRVLTMPVAIVQYLAITAFAWFLAPGDKLLWFPFWIGGLLSVGDVLRAC
jgi:hypothetical protein